MHSLGGPPEGVLPQAFMLQSPRYPAIGCCMPSLDPRLADWPTLNHTHRFDALLLGNGFSRALWKPFGYFSLFEEATRVRHRALGVSDQALFKSLGTELFEPVLSGLNATVRTNAALAINSTAPLNRYYSIKEALIHAVRATHPAYARLPGPTLTALAEALRSFSRVYTSNYDLLLPWAMEQAPEGFATTFDAQGFFDVRRIATQGQAARATQVVHLHGGLHLLKLPDGSTRQRLATGSELLDGFAVNIPGELPLFVNEAPSEQKLTAIRRSDYLSWGLGQLAGERTGLCLFGQHLDASDGHLTEAIRQARPAHLAIAIRPLSEASVLHQQQHYLDRFADLDGTALHFFDASTHPLGQVAQTVALAHTRR